MQDTALDHQSHAYGTWEQYERQLGGALPARLLFALVYLLLIYLDSVLCETPDSPIVLRPSAGILMGTLWLSRRANWPMLLLVHVAAATAAELWSVRGWSSHSMAMAILPGMVAATSGAYFCRNLLRVPLEPQVALVPRAVGGMVLGSACGAAMAVLLESLAAPAGSNLLFTSTASTMSYSLGTLATCPVVLTWVQQLRQRHPELTLNSRAELLGIACWIFVPLVLGAILLRGPSSSLLSIPLVVGPALIVACLRLPPRWATLLAATFITGFMLLAVTRAAPYSVADPALRLGLLQTMAGIFVVVPFVLSVGIAQLRLTMASLRQSENRYRGFVQMSHDAVWRIEISPPMPLSLPSAERRTWLHTHARIVESNASHDLLCSARSSHEPGAWWRSIPWGPELEQRLAGAVRGIDIEDLRFSVVQSGRTRTYLASVQAVEEDGHVRGFWGVARDVTALVDLNDQLTREQDRLRSYAKLTSDAEEKARRSTAVDLHDGIGQTLVGMQMMVEVARQRPPESIEPLLGELAMRLREVQGQTRRMISDLSPPGLYELGLEPALQWLSRNLKSQYGLDVELHCRVDNSSVPIGARILIFKLVRELLRNVVKHAGVLQARVEAVENARHLRIVVSDRGNGFELTTEMPGNRANGFGLWSIADRIREFGGTLQVDAAKGRGARFEMIFPVGMEN